MKTIGGVLLAAGILLILLGWMHAGPPPELVILDDQSAPRPSSVSPVKLTPAVQSISVQTPVVFNALPESIPAAILENTLVPVTGQTNPFGGDDKTPGFLSFNAEHLAQVSQTNIPIRLEIPTIKLDISILPATWRKVLYEGYIFDQWKSPRNAGGWQTDSAQLGNPGNTVINGHNNEFGEVFRNLDQIHPGDLIFAYSVDREFSYIVTNSMILLEEGESSKQRVENASWIGRTNDERLTLVSCWPYDTNTHRIIIVAQPVTIQNEK